MMNGPVRVLQVVGRMDRGGAETMLMNLYRFIDRSKVQFDFLVHTNEQCDYDGEIRKLGGNIYHMPRYAGKNHLLYIKRWQDFLKSHPELKIIHGHMRSTAAIYLRIAKRYGLFTIAHSHSTASRGNKIEQLIKNIMQIPIRFSADFFLACSEEAGKWLFGEKTTKKDNYKVLRNAIDVKKYRFDEGKRDEIRKILGIEDSFVVGHVGSFTSPKNHRFLLNVFHEMQRQAQNSVLLLVGDGPLRAEIEKQISGLGLQRKVILTGKIPNVNDYLQAMDVFVFPSTFEGIPLAMVEAQAAGLPCIISDRISPEVLITDSIKSLPLHQNFEVWAQEILEFKNGYQRRDTTDEIYKAGYDVESNARWLERFYIERVLCINHF